ncbi:MULTISPECIES: RNA polymerase factor sigma-54 [unclassified Polaromonas]|jgi:RNA polymerase sigma-54 factor|uniref:RNA polymerase factor sigma-54 n=1 Tax=unclassified Polaromonas TaxID=2638319 RepID=UPI000BDB54DA|nr:MULTISPECIES: RNA polymerase factor sigma-54 [unclassified Polaromonas]OYY33991.1 MAG: RNA polymerase factor sigma-54 [Polaromonas sp. 35-63-35]OYZ20812.1 MAG: RNA polymerase factor sigma-54 [Polaromonas sp. 16-63-31]OYZ78404.1 MAG: RNA polymerase factor sigma-54 [Polaromonas sp. 24-63-21]OZA49161.1 MAG: RNA polymerase factor sigma-54 [Polaromonas sp. 17-63-33]OZA85915.1 MAG: RNA polymerase factor sigma-54 [Polaromonas sp. 39-63-25]
MKQGLSLRVSQHLALTPQLQQSIRLLQLSTLELSQEVEQMLDENPFLEVAEEAAPREDFGLGQVDTPVSQETREFESTTDSIAVSAEDTGAAGQNDAEPSSEAKLEESWEGDGSVDTAPDDNEWGGDATPRKNNNDDSDVDATELARSHESLQDHLHRQALSLRLSPEGKAALHFLIESLNDDGYLEDSLSSLAAGLAGDDLEQLEAVEHEFAVALKLLQHMEPAGVGARNLAECLSLQLLDCKNNDETRAAIAMCQQPMELLAKRDVKRLSQLCGFPEAVIKGAIGLIGRLDPKPGRRFVNVERNLIVPDVLVVKSGRGFKVSLNSDVMPRLRVHDIYANALKQNKGQGGQALQQRLQEARWFIKNIQQRFDTILRVSSAIVERQKNFFTHGELAMRPLVLREIADELGLHESTISRVTTAKYMSTPFGTFELKYFFGSALGTETGGNASSTAVRALIKQFVASESLKKPLSDNQISEMLKEQGIECARRTVAKYREALRIAPANLRKSL